MRYQSRWFDGTAPGINGLGRIGKLTMWQLVADSYIGKVVVSALLGVVCLYDVAAAENLWRFMPCVSENTPFPKAVFLLWLLILLLKSLRAFILRPDHVQKVFHEWRELLKAGKKGLIGFSVLYVLTGVADYIGWKPKAWQREDKSIESKTDG